MWQVAHDTVLLSESIGSLKSRSPSATLAWFKPLAARRGGIEPYDLGATFVGDIGMPRARSVSRSLGKKNIAKIMAVATTKTIGMINFKLFSFSANCLIILIDDSLWLNRGQIFYTTIQAVLINTISRPERIEFDGAYYLIINLGSGREDILHSRECFALFLNVLSDPVRRFDIEIHAYCLMTNHYQLLVSMPFRNFRREMRHVRSVYT